MCTVLYFGDSDFVVNIAISKKPLLTNNSLIKKKKTTCDISQFYSAFNYGSYNNSYTILFPYQVCDLPCVHVYKH